MISFSRRRTRLRTTAPPTRLLAEKPKRLAGSSLGKAQSTIRRWVQHVPWRRTCWKRSRPRRRSRRFKSYQVRLR